MSVKDWTKFISLGLIWGSSFLWIKIAVSEVGPFTLVAFRVLFAALGLVAFILLTRTRVGDLRTGWKPFAIMAVFNVAVPFVLISWSEQHIASSMASILNSTTPLFTILISPLFLKDERISLSRIAGLLVGFVGVVLLMSRGLSEVGKDPLEPVGQITMLVAAISYAGASVYGRRTTHSFPPGIYSLGQMGLATLIMWGVAPIAEAPFTLPTLPITWVALVWLGVLGSAVGTLLFFELLRSVGPTRTTLVTYVFPLVGMILGVLFLNEQMDWRILLGGALIISGIVVVNARSFLRRPATSPLNAQPAAGQDPSGAKEQ